MSCRAIPRMRKKLFTEKAVSCHALLCLSYKKREKKEAGERHEERHEKLLALDASGCRVGSQNVYSTGNTYASKDTVTAGHA